MLRTRGAEGLHYTTAYGISTAKLPPFPHRTGHPADGEAENASVVVKSCCRTRIGSRQSSWRQSVVQSRRGVQLLT